MATALVQGLGGNEGHKGGAAQPLQQDKHPQTLGQRSQRADDGGSTARDMEGDRRERFNIRKLEKNVSVPSKEPVMGTQGPRRMLPQDQ